MKNYEFFSLMQKIKYLNKRFTFMKNLIHKDKEFYHDKKLYIL